MSVMIENPIGVKRVGGKIIRVSQEAIDNATSFQEILGDANEIGDEAFANLDLSKWCKVKNPCVVTSHKPSKTSNHNRTVDVQSDIYIPSTITKIGDRAFKSVKGVQIIEVGSRYFDHLGSSSYARGCTDFGEEAFANIEGLQIVCIAASPQEVKLGKNIFLDNNFINEFNHYTTAFGGAKNGLWGFSSINNISDKITNFNSSLSVKPISPILTGQPTKNNISVKTGIAELIDEGM